jgi:preprotein translocase subunit YajC
MVVIAIIAFVLIAFFHLVSGQRSRLEENENKLKSMQNS